jgi:hypothetical protein
MLCRACVAGRCARSWMRSAPAVRFNPHPRRMPCMLRIMIPDHRAGSACVLQVSSARAPFRRCWMSWRPLCARAACTMTRRCVICRHFVVLELSSFQARLCWRVALRCTRRCCTRCPTFATPATLSTFWVRRTSRKPRSFEDLVCTEVLNKIAGSVPAWRVLTCCRCAGVARAADDRRSPADWRSSVARFDRYLLMSRNMG